MNKNEDVDLKIRAARLLTLKKAPYLGAALWRMRIIKSDRVSTAGVDKWWRLYVKPDFVVKISTEELAGVWAHEAWHLLRGHSRRAEALGISYEDKSAENAARAEIWNVAADCEINDDLNDFKLPAGAVHPSTFQLDNDELMPKPSPSPAARGLAARSASGRTAPMVMPWLAMLRPRSFVVK